MTGSGGLARSVRERLGASGAEDRLLHVEGVVMTIRGLATESGWAPERISAVERAAWYHAALKPESVDALTERIVASGETPDPWIADRAENLLHAHAAAVWAVSEWGEDDPEVIEAVRHHPTGHPEWGDLGFMLYVADFCEPGRAYAAAVGATSLLAVASTGRMGLERAAREIIDHRVAWLRHRGRAVHPLTEAWRLALAGDR